MTAVRKGSTLAAKTLALFTLALFTLALFGLPAGAAAAERALVLDIDGAIGPPTAD